MKYRLLLAALALTTLTPAAAIPPPPLPDPAAQLRDQALAGDTVAWDMLEGLTTEVGPRMAGTEAEARAREWAVARLWLRRELGS